MLLLYVLALGTLVAPEEKATHILQFILNRRPDFKMLHPCGSKLQGATHILQFILNRRPDFKMLHPCGLKLHVYEDSGTAPATIDMCLSVA